MSPMRLPEFDPIEFLLNRRFSGAWALDLPPSLTGVARPRPDDGKFRESVATYRSELAALKPEDLEKRVSEEKAKASEEARVKREQEEQALFFHQPLANADFSHWSKAAHWTLDEAIALSFGKAPEHVRWEKVQSLTLVSPFAARYAGRRELALRALHWEQLFDPVLPGIFLAWAKRLEIPVPVELTAAIEARGIQIVDWQSRFKDMKAFSEKVENDWKEMTEKQGQDLIRVVAERDGHIAALNNRIADLERGQASSSGELPDKPVGPKERESLLKLVIGMAVGGYGYDPDARRSEQTQAIADDLLRSGIPLDVDTVRKWLKQASELLPSDERSTRSEG